MLKQTLSPKELAEAVGVSESSLKRWADRGRIRVTRTVGGHRRITLQEAVRFVREARLPLHHPAVFGLAEIDEAHSQMAHEGPPAERLFSALYHGRAEEARGILFNLYLAGEKLSVICDGPLRDAMYRIGDLWRHEEPGIFIEHRATDIVIQALNMLRCLATKTDLPREGEALAPVALGATPSDDPYIIPSLTVACLMADLGFDEINLGPNTPLHALLAAAEAYKPRLVWLSCSYLDAMPSNEQLHQLADDLAELNAAFTVGGQAALRSTVETHPNLFFCHTLGELEAFARGLLQR